VKRALIRVKSLLQKYLPFESLGVKSRIRDATLFERIAAQEEVAAGQKWQSNPSPDELLRDASE